MACQPKEFDGKGGAIAYTRWVEKIESVIDMSNCAINQKVKFVAGSLTGKALTWWNTQVHARGRTIAVGMACDDFKTLQRDEYCPPNEMQRLENELWKHTMVGAGHTANTDRFHKLAKLVSRLVTPKFKRIDRYIYGLVPETRGMVQAAEPSTIQSAILKVGGLTDDVVRNVLLKRSSEKRKESGETDKQEIDMSNDKRARTRKGFVATDSGKKEYKGLHP
ncbi:reverse transcriptase domain-containing protein [Tanacetum coccineum]